MKTLLHEIEEKQKAVADPSTWTDERRALKEDIRERKERLATARVHAPLLLAIVRDLAFGNEAAYSAKVAAARKHLLEAGLLTFEECRQVRGETAEVVQAEQPPPVPREPRPEDLTPGVRGFDCGDCGKPVVPRYASKKCDGWHWHRECWDRFLGR